MKKHPACIPALLRAGISLADAYALRQQAMTLHRWYESECGDETGGIERDETTGITYRYNSRTGHRTRCLDRETSSLRRVAAIMSAYPHLSVYHQTDPRGAPIYVLRDGDVPVGERPDAYYSRGLPVYK